MLLKDLEERFQTAVKTLWWIPPTIFLLIIILSTTVARYISVKSVPESILKKIFFRNPHEPAHVYFSENVSLDFIRSTELILFLDYLDVKYLKLMPCIQKSLA